ncbi:MAG: MFS transporter [Candidatus Heimdallarchaeota archaeon]|nr:MFS transporter [Candidatus Heimdallarchaeota archaeon]
MALHEIALHPSRKINIRVLVFANLINGLITGFYNVILQPFIVELIQLNGNNINPEETLGTIMTLASLIMILPMIFAAKLSDKIGRKRVILGSFIFLPIAMLFLGIAGLLPLKQPMSFFTLPDGLLIEITNYPHFIKNGLSITYALAVAFLGLSCFSLGIGFGDPATGALTAESAEKKKTASSFSLINMAFYATGLIGPLVIRIFTNKIEIWVYFFILAALRLIMFIYQLFALKEPHVIKDYSSSIFKQFIQSLKAIYLLFVQMFKSIFLYLSVPVYFVLRRNKEKERGNYYRDVETNLNLLKEIFRNPGVPYAIGFFMLDALTWGLSISIFWGSLVTQYNFDEGNIAVLNLVFYLSTLIFFIPVTKISDKLRKPQLLLLSQLTGGLFFASNIIAYFTLPQYRLYIILIGWIGMGASVAFWMPGIMSILTNFDKKRRAEAYGLVQGLHNLGWLPTSFLAGIIISRVNFLAVFIISLVLLPFNLLMAWKFPIKEEQEEEKLKVES